MRILKYILLWTPFMVLAQTDYSKNWDAFFSYKQIKDFTINGNMLYAVANNAAYTYDINLNTYQTINTLNGLTAEEATVVVYDESRKQLIIGYNNGLINVIKNNGTITPLVSLRDNLILPQKGIKTAYINNNSLYLGGEFGVTVIDLNKLEFKDTYKIGQNTNSDVVTQLTVNANILYISTKQGIFNINLANTVLNPYVFSDWTKLSTSIANSLVVSNNQAYVTIGSKVFLLSNLNNILFDAGNTITAVTTIENKLTITTSDSVLQVNSTNFTVEDTVLLTNMTSHPLSEFTKSIIANNQIYTKTDDNGVLTSALSNKSSYVAIVPEGPVSDTAFKVTANNNQFWICYGGYFSDLNEYWSKTDVEGFYNNKWYTIKSNDLNPNPSKNSAMDFIKVAIDPYQDDKIYIAAFGQRVGGVSVMNYDESLDKWTLTKTFSNKNTNTNGPVGLNTRIFQVNDYNQISDVFIDRDKNLWAINSLPTAGDLFSKYLIQDDTWDRRISMANLISDAELRGKEMFEDENGNYFAIVKYNLSNIQNILAFNKTTNKTDNDSFMNLISPSDLGLSGIFINKVIAINKQIWVATSQGLFVLTEYDKIFNNESISGAARLVYEENGVAKELLANDEVKDIIIDNAGNLWFATAKSGVVKTTNDGQTVLATYTTSNSPLPTNAVDDLELDETTGDVYMATFKGLVKFKSGIVTYGDRITEVVAYPNPAVKNQVGHDVVTIVSKDGTGLPNGTNVKIMDVSGKLVYETNVIESQQEFGGKVVWNKQNLQGKAVVSGIYIVLVSNANGSENTTTKIAIINN